MSNLDLAVVDLFLNLGGVLAIDGATNGDASSEDFLDGTLEGGRVRLGAHLLSDFNNVIELDLAVVDGVLNLLSVSWWFLEGHKDEGCGGWEHGDKADSVLDHDLNKNLDSFPLKGGLLDVFTDLLWGKTERTAFGCESSSSGDFSANYLHVDVLLFIGICGRLGWHCVFLPIY